MQVDDTASKELFIQFRLMEVQDGIIVINRKWKLANQMKVYICMNAIGNLPPWSAQSF